MKILVGIVASERNNFSWYFIQSLLNLQSYMRDRAVIVHAHSGTIPDGRNYILDAAKQHGCEYALMIDSDMTFPKSGADMLIDSMKVMDAKIGCGIYFGTYPPFNSKPMAFDADANGVQTALEKWDKVQYIRTCGMGFTAIHKDLFDIRFEFRPGQGEDHLFCKEAEKRGVKIILDPFVKCGHLRTIPLFEKEAKAIYG